MLNKNLLHKYRYFSSLLRYAIMRQGSVNITIEAVARNKKTTSFKYNCRDNILNLKEFVRYNNNMTLTKVGSQTYLTIQIFVHHS